MPYSAVPSSRTVLLIAYHFPPFKGSSGVQRTLRFSQHLSRFGWRPIILSIVPSAYEATTDSRGNELDSGMVVERAFGFDAARRLSLFGRYPRALALPDRWASWRFDAVRRAMKLIRQYQVSVIWSTFPIASAHRIAADIARRSGLAWVAEFRDPMWEGEYPPEPAMNRAWFDLEARVFREADGVVVTAPGALSWYQERYPQYPRHRLVMIENGYDEETFLRAEATLAASGAAKLPDRRPFTLLHSGIVYRGERDPTQLFTAIAHLKETGAINSDDLQVILRACGDEVGYRRDISLMGINDIVRLEPAIDYLDALREMLTVDGLLILQAASCNAQVPAKLYEYLRAGRPIIALTDPAGDTARTLDRAGAGLIARLDDQAAIEGALLRFMTEVRGNSWRRPSASTIASYAREAQAGQLARVLNEVVGG